MESYELVRYTTSLQHRLSAMIASRTGRNPVLKNWSKAVAFSGQGKTFHLESSETFTIQQESIAVLSRGIFTPLNTLTHSTGAKTVSLGPEPFHS